MQRPVYQPFLVFSALFALCMFWGNAEADPLTPTAKVTVTTLVRADGTPPKVIRLARNEVFLFRGHSVRPGDSMEVVFTKGGDSFRVHVSTGFAVPFDLLAGVGIPLRGPATVRISGKGLVAYEIQEL
ncbi:MAG: hypothetical protein ACREA0_01070 [bacterium]